MVTEASVPRLSSQVELQRVGGEVFVTTEDAALHTFEHLDGQASEVAQHIVGLVDGRRSVADIVASVVEEFEVSPEVALKDARHFIELLVERRVLHLQP